MVSGTPWLEGNREPEPRQEHSEAADSSKGLAEVPEELPHSPSEGHTGEAWDGGHTAAGLTAGAPRQPAASSPTVLAGTQLSPRGLPTRAASSELGTELPTPWRAARQRPTASPSVTLREGPSTRFDASQLPGDTAHPLPACYGVLSRSQRPRCSSCTKARGRTREPARGASVLPSEHGDPVVVPLRTRHQVPAAGAAHGPGDLLAAAPGQHDLQRFHGTAGERSTAVRLRQAAGPACGPARLAGRRAAGEGTPCPGSAGTRGRRSGA